MPIGNREGVKRGIEGACSYVQSQISPRRQQIYTISPIIARRQVCALSKRSAEARKSRLAKLAFFFGMSPS